MTATLIPIEPIQPEPVSDLPGAVNLTCPMTGTSTCPVGGSPACSAC